MLDFTAIGFIVGQAVSVRERAGWFVFLLSFLNILSVGLQPEAKAAGLYKSDASNLSSSYMAVGKQSHKKSNCSNRKLLNLIVRLETEAQLSIVLSLLLVWSGCLRELVHQLIWGTECSGCRAKQVFTGWITSCCHGCSCRLQKSKHIVTLEANVQSHWNSCGTSLSNHSIVIKFWKNKPTT